MAKTEKGIKFSIERKVKDWLSSIDDDDVRAVAEANVIVTGGCIVSMLLDERVRDYDIYFRTIDAAETVARYYVDRFNDQAVVVVIDELRVRIMIPSVGAAGVVPGEADDYFESAPLVQEARLQQGADEDEEKPKYRPIFMSENAITLSDSIQLVVRFYGEPEEIHKNYDYVHCTCYWTPKDGLVCSNAALMAIMTKELIYTGSLYPICAAIRIRKFVARGWKINAGQFVKIASQINDLDLTSIAVWEDQLTGVDTVYFQQLIDILKSHSSDGTIEKSYVVALIDKMF